jgi:hypothetical protein
VVMVELDILATLLELQWFMLVEEEVGVMTT